MNYRGEITLPFGDGEYTFKLAVTGLLELEEKCSAPFAVIFGRVAGGAYGVNDVLETLRLGLIGGGMSAAKAKTQVDRYGMPLAETAPLARLVLAGVMFGFEVAPPPGKPEAKAEEPQSTSASTPSPSQEAQSSPVSAQKNLDELRSGNWWQ